MSISYPEPAILLVDLKLAKCEHYIACVQFVLIARNRLKPSKVLSEMFNRIKVVPFLHFLSGQ